MSETTNISWADSTFNPWVGCQKVSAGCDNCYAETLMDKRWHKVQWGPHGERKKTSHNLWRQPVTWNAHFAAFQSKHGHRQRVFCASLADVFDNQVPVEWRAALWELIAATANLDWLLLTKRPENIAKMLPSGWCDNLGDSWPNVWLGTTCENQDAYDRRWPILSKIPARIRFISYEPAIGPLDIISKHHTVPNWLICGGESSHGFRPMDLAWAARVKQDCELHEVPFFMKQVSANKPKDEMIPAELMLRQFPRLDYGRTWKHV